MAQILINIPDFLYKQILKKHVSKATIARVFQNGVVLPKGHGRLVDADEVGKYVIIGNADLRKCPTIIEADKEG